MKVADLVAQSMNCEVAVRVSRVREAESVRIAQMGNDKRGATLQFGVIPHFVLFAEIKTSPHFCAR